MIRVVLAEDEALLRSGLRLLLEHEGDIEVVADVADGAAAITATRRHRPDLLIVDLRMPGVGGIETLRLLRADEGLAATRALVLTTFDDRADVLGALRAGADGYLLKDTDADELRRAVRVVAGGARAIAPSVLDTVLQSVTRARITRPELIDDLTAREREILAEVARGRSNAEIAADLHLSTATVRTYVSRLLSRTGARDRAQLVVLGYESGVADSG